MTTHIPGWINPLSVDPDDRPAITAANLVAIEAHKAATVGVTTVEELDALPVGSVVLSEQGGVWQVNRDEEGVTFLTEPGSEWGSAPQDITLPARVLYRGTS